MKPEDCPKLDQCPKIAIVMDKDMPDDVRARCIRDVCAKCEEGKRKSTLILDEEGITCSVCGKDIYHCRCEENK